MWLGPERGVADRPDRHRVAVNGRSHVWRSEYARIRCRRHDLRR
ncbi:hypothetical protein ATKI12_5419 [Kitasatospora sp. Ki12]